jgi:hypothetical protein
MFFFDNDAQARELQKALDILKGVYARYYACDMLIALERNMGFLQDARFMAAIKSAQRDDQEADLLWRLHVLCWCAANALKLDGDFVECGVFRGFCTAVAAQYLDFANCGKTWHLYDTFSGIPADELGPGAANPAAFQDPSLYASVVARFAGYPNLKVHRGRVPGVLADSAPARIAFLHLDMNSAPAEVGALEVLYDRLVPGAYLLLDDYGWYPYRQQKSAEDAFFAARETKVLELPTGQGLVIKSAQP